MKLLHLGSMEVGWWGYAVITNEQEGIELTGKAEQLGMYAYQREGCANPQEVVGDGKAKDV